MSYDLSSLPATASIARAELDCGYVDINGDIMGFGDVILQHVDFINYQEVFTSRIRREWTLFNFSSAVPTQATTTIDLVEALESSLSALDPQLQFRVLFDGLTPSDQYGLLSWTDWPIIDANRDGGCDAQIEVDYLVP